MLYSYLNPPHTAKKTGIAQSKIFERKREKEKPNRCLCGIQTDDCCIPIQRTGNRTFIVKKANPPALNPSNWAARPNCARGPGAYFGSIRLFTGWLLAEKWPKSVMVGGCRTSQFLKLYTKSVFFGRYRSVFLGITNTNTREYLGRYFRYQNFDGSPSKNWREPPFS